MSGKIITFADGDALDIDSIILCSGYIPEFPFLSKNLQAVNLIDNYKFVFNVNDPTLAYIGFVRPIVGSIPGIAEMQAQWVTKVWSRKIEIAGEEERITAVKDDAKFWMQYFESTSHRLQTLVEGYAYLDDIAKLSKVYPDYWSLFKRNPSGFFTAYFAPYNGCSFRLNEPEMEAMALETLRRHSRDTITPMNLALNLLMRLIWFDWFLDQLSVVKYWLQTSRFLRPLSSTRIVRALDYIWTTPKRYLFDDKTGH